MSKKSKRTAVAPGSVRHADRDRVHRRDPRRRGVHLAREHAVQHPGADLLERRPLWRGDGRWNAPVTIEEWADFQCPACRAFAINVEPQLRAAYIATGKVRFIFQNFAFLGVESEWAAQAAECAAAAEGRVVGYHDRLYTTQGGENSGAFSKANLKKISDALGVGGPFAACVDSGAYAANVRDSRSAGQAKGVQATPTLFSNGTRVEGALTLGRRLATAAPASRSRSTSARAARPRTRSDGSACATPSRRTSASRRRGGRATPSFRS